MKKYVFVVLLVVILLLFAGYKLFSNNEKEVFNQDEKLESGNQLYEENLTISGDIYAEDENLTADELWNLCNKQGDFIIRKKLGDNKFLVHILSENDLEIKSDGREIARDGINYGEEALEKTSILKVNKNAANWLTIYAEGMQYAWNFYRRENDDTIYVPNPEQEYVYYPQLEVLSSELEIIDDPNHEIWKEKFPLSIIMRRFDQYESGLEVEPIEYKDNAFSTILYRAKLVHEDFENLYKYGAEISREDYEKKLKTSSNFLEFKYDNKTINIFPSDFTNFEALIMENDKYYILEDGTLDEWNVSMLFVSLEIFLED